MICSLHIVMALLFDFLNGMNDAANSIATIASTRVLTPRFAVAWVLTLPGSALISSLAYMALKAFGAA
jgi:phosphate/sulfate permease